MFIFVPIILGVLLALYCYRYITKTLRFFGLLRDGKRLPRYPFVGAFVLCAAFWSVGQLVVLVLLHVMVLSGLLWLLHLPFRRFSKIRKAYECRLIPLFFGLFAVFFGFFHIRNVHATHYTIETESLQMRIVFLSDLHYPNAMSPKRLREYCDEISQAKPDLVIFGGDIVDESTSEAQTHECITILDSIESTHGSYFIFGNHDNLHRTSENPALMQALQKSDITALADERVKIGALTLIGRKDRSNSTRTPLSELMPQEDSFVLVVDHQPLDAEETVQCGADLMLSGHTHNGQIWPIGFINALLGPKYGHYTLEEMDLLVSSGIVGWGYPVRTQGISEYVILDLVCP